MGTNVNITMYKKEFWPLISYSNEWPHTLPLLSEHKINFLNPGEMFMYNLIFDIC